MNETVVFVGPNKRITSLEIEAYKAGFKPIEVCAFDFQYHYSAGKLIEMLNAQDKPALFRFIYPFNDLDFRDEVARLKVVGIDNITAELQVFEQMTAGWKKLTAAVEVPTTTVNDLDAVGKVKNKSVQYRTLVTNMKHALPDTIFLDQGQQVDTLVEMLDCYGGLVYKPIFGANSTGIIMVKKHPGGYLFQSDIKHKRTMQIYTGNIRDKLSEIHNPRYLVQGMLKCLDFYDHRDFDIRVHLIDGKVSGTAAFVFNPEIKDEEVHSLEAAAEKDPRLHEAVEEAIMISVEATKLLGLDISGVDLIITDKYKPQITEVNSFPGWRPQLELIPDFNIAREEVAFYERLLR
jgi:glutathione synthase/RimK-type ligase-like ATP-grasp enzyme